MRVGRPIEVSPNGPGAYFLGVGNVSLKNDQAKLVILLPPNKLVILGVGNMSQQNQANLVMLLLLRTLPVFCLFLLIYVYLRWDAKGLAEVLFFCV